MPSIKPCDEACPKCGSSDATHIYHKKGTTFRGSSTGLSNWMRQSEFIKQDETDKQRYMVIKEGIFHSCNCCKYGWVSEVVKSDNITGE